jgi:hypothetical protein
MADLRAGDWEAEVVEWPLEPPAGEDARRSLPELRGELAAAPPPRPALRGEVAGSPPRGGVLGAEGEVWVMGWGPGRELRRGEVEEEAREVDVERAEEEPEGEPEGEGARVEVEEVRREGEGEEGGLKSPRFGVYLRVIWTVS